MTAKTKSSSTIDSLRAAEDAARKDDLASALGRLLEAWRAKPAREIADAIEAVGARAASGLEPPTGTTPKERNAGWDAAAKKGDPVFVQILASTMTQTKGSAETLARVELLVKLPPDPRIASRICDLVETPIYNASVSRTNAFWKRVFALLPELGDPRIGERAQLFVASWAKNGELNEPERPELAKRLGKIMPALASAYGPVPALTAEEKATCDAIVPAIPAPSPVAVAAKEASKKTKAELLAAIHDAPDDDAPRLVYADWLTERGDPRGEFIVLQIARARGDKATREQITREKELLARHMSKWFDGLDVKKTGAKFHRGFLSTCETEDRIDEAPAWSTVREVNTLPVTDGARAASLRVATSALSGNIVALAKMKKPLAVEEITLRGPSWTRDVGFEGIHAEATRALAKIRVLPALKRLFVRGTSTWIPVFDRPPRLELDWLLEAPCVHALDELAFPFMTERIAKLYPALASTKIKRVVIASATESYWPGWQTIFSRDDEGKLSRLEIIAPDDAVPSMHVPLFGLHHVRAIAALPQTALTHVRVAIPAKAWRAYLATMKKPLVVEALARQKRLRDPVVEKI